MGAWGPKLYQDDVAKDVKDGIIDLLKRGRTIEEATEELIEKNSFLIEDEEDGSVFWLALADTQWNIGRLLPFVKKKALDIIKNDENLKLWEDSSTKEYSLRKEILEELQVKLNSPMPKEKKISKYKYFKTTWKTGDTFVLKLDSEYAKEKGLYGRYLILYTLYGFLYPKGDLGDIFPVTYIKITNDANVPNNINEIEQSEFIKLARYPKENKYFYRLINMSKSKKILNKFIYIGNFNIKSPIDEKTIVYSNRKTQSYIYIDDYKGERIEATSFVDFSDKSLKGVIDTILLQK